MAADLSAETPLPCAICGGPFHRTAVMMLADGRKQQQALCRTHAEEARRATLDSSSSVVAGTEFWDWPTTQRYAKLAAEGYTITHMGEVMQQVHSERPAEGNCAKLGIAQVEPGIWLIDIEKHPSLGTAIEHRLHELRARTIRPTNPILKGFTYTPLVNEQQPESD